MLPLLLLVLCCILGFQGSLANVNIYRMEKKKVTTNGLAWLKNTTAR